METMVSLWQRWKSSMIDSQGNNFTLGNGTLTKTEDCPSNVFVL